MKQVRLRKGKEESLKRFHPWVFSGAIASIDEGITEGEVVRVVANSGDFIAVAGVQPRCLFSLPSESIGYVAIGQTTVRGHESP